MMKRLRIAGLFISIFLATLSIQPSNAGIFGPSECQKNKSDTSFQDSIGKAIWKKYDGVWADKLKHPGTSRNFEIVTLTMDLSQNYLLLTKLALAHQKCYTPNQIANITNSKTLFQEALTKSKSWLKDEYNWDGFWKTPLYSYPWTLKDFMNQKN
jgi:hypothetical protein